MVIEVQGANAYGLLKSERGAHRLIRFSPFNAQNLRQTSFASVGVIPDVGEDAEIEVRDEDIRVDTYRSSGAGGQHVNKTESAIRITHLASGIVVTCQNERSQIKNRASAMHVLKARLLDRQRQQQEEAMAQSAASKPTSPSAIKFAPTGCNPIRWSKITAPSMKPAMPRGYWKVILTISCTRILRCSRVSAWT
jgi:protein subunit release factor B